MPGGAAANVREVTYGEVPTADLHGGLTEDFKRLALASAGAQALVLDLGCGEGRVALLLAPHAKRVVGLDKDAKTLEAARARARSLGVANVEFHAADLEKEPATRWAPGGADLVVSHLFLSKTVVERAHDALRPGGAFVFTAFGPRQWQEAGGSAWAHAEQEVRGWLNAAHLKLDHLSAEDTRVRFQELPEVRAYLGEETVGKWQRDGRWEKLVASFRKAKVLTESRITAQARR